MINDLTCLLTRSRFCYGMELPKEVREDKDMKALWDHADSIIVT